MVAFHISVGKIRPQRDEYATAAGKRVQDAEFWQGSEVATDVLQFKRFVVDIEIESGGKRENAAILISTRGNLVTVTGAPTLGIRPVEIYNALKLVSERFDYTVAAQPYFPSYDRGFPVTPVPIREQSDRVRHYSVTGNPFWLADVLHHVREAGGFDDQGKMKVP